MPKSTKNTWMIYLATLIHFSIQAEQIAMFIRNPENKTREQIKDALALEDAMGTDDKDFPEKLTVRHRKDAPESVTTEDPIFIGGINITDIPCW